MNRSSYTIFMRCYTTSVYPAEVESGPLGNVRRVVVGVQGVALSSPFLQSQTAQHCLQGAYDRSQRFAWQLQ